MRLGQILVKRGLVTPPAISAALQRQKARGGRLGENLIALGYLTAEQLASVLTETPIAPSQLSAMRLERSTLRNLVLKWMYLGHCETVLDLGGCLKLPSPIIEEVLDEARQFDRKQDHTFTA